MIEYIQYRLKQSTLKTWVAFSLFHKLKSRSALKQRIERAINYLNRILKPLNLEVWVREKGKKNVEEAKEALRGVSFEIDVEIGGKTIKDVVVPIFIFEDK